jgi:hypothetical protein
MPRTSHNNFAQELNDYFKALALSSTLIPYDGTNKKYLQMGIEEIIAAGSQFGFDETFGMIYEPIDFKVSGKSSDDLRMSPAIGLWFLKFAPKDDFAARKAVEEEAFRIASSFLGKIKKDQEAYSKGEDPEALIKNFDLNTAELKLSGKVGDYHYGYILEFEIFNDGQIMFNQAEWV